jgi:hypothetical protein
MEKSQLLGAAFEMKLSSPEILYLLELVQSDVTRCREHSIPEDQLSLRDRQEIERKLREAWSAHPQPHGVFYLHMRTVLVSSVSEG